MALARRQLLRGSIAFGAVLALLVGAATIGRASSSEPSRCHGTVSDGRLESGWRLPRTGPNFRAYSDIGWGVGRTWVHSTVYEVVLGAYERLARGDAGRTWIYGETGWPSGGRIDPHRTHQNGLSVDFMVPLRDRSGRVAELPTSSENRYGYGERFDDAGRSQSGVIDFEAVAAHLAALREAARAAGVGIAKVIFEPPLRMRLRGTDAWQAIRGLPFTRRPVWVRHDNHYHVDFDVPCR